MPAIRMPKSWNGPISAAAPLGQPPGRAPGVAPAGAEQASRGARGAVGRATASKTACDTADSHSRQLRTMTGEAAGVTGRAPMRLTSRGGILTSFAFSFAGAFGASVSHVAALTGIAYFAGCILTAFAVRRTQLLAVVVTPPALLATAVLCVQAVTASGGALSIAGGILVTLGNAAPWLFAGTVLGTLIALARGLAGNVRSLRESLRVGDRG